MEFQISFKVDGNVRTELVSSANEAMAWQQIEDRFGMGCWKVRIAEATKCAICGDGINDTEPHVYQPKTGEAFHLIHENQIIGRKQVVTIRAS